MSCGAVPAGNWPAFWPARGERDIVSSPMMFKEFLDLHTYLSTYSFASPWRAMNVNDQMIAEKIAIHASSLYPL